MAGDDQPREKQAEDASTSVSLEAALYEAALVRRRKVLRGLGIGVAALAVGGGGVALYMRHEESAGKELSGTRAREAETALLAGDIAKAKKLAKEGRDLDPNGHAAAIAYLRVNAFDLIDGDGDENASVALVSEARKLGATGATIALVTLAGAIAVKNDRLVDKILHEPRDEGVAQDGFFAFAAGAALDFGCAPGSAHWYEVSLELLKDGYLANVRHARSLLFAGDFDRARAAIAALPERFEKTVLLALAARMPVLEGLAGERGPQIDRGKIGELPRSLRTLATALALEDPDQPWGQSAGLDAALDDVDSPLVAIIAGRLALAGGDRVSARAAAKRALDMRDDLDEAKLFGARVALVDGDLEASRSLAAEGPKKAMIMTIRAIEAYEAADAKRLAEIAKDADTGRDRWALYADATKILEGGQPDRAAIDRLVAMGEPWADFVAFDAALAEKDHDKAKKIAATWSGKLTPAQKTRKANIESGGTLRSPAPPAQP